MTGVSSFFGYYNSHRAILAQQASLNVIGHNISNANTEGYSRQRAELEAYSPWSQPSMNTNISKGQLGQGVIVDQVVRLRDNYLQEQYRLSNSRLNNNQTASSTLSQIEQILAEPSDNGLNTPMQNFFDAAQELSLHPSSTAARSDFLQQAANLITSFQQQGQALQDLRTHLVGDPSNAGTLSSSEVSIYVSQINEKLAAITNLNQDINAVTSAGGQPNDLLDRRDVLLEELSALADVSVTHTSNNMITVQVAGHTMVRGVTQVDALNVITNTGATADDTPALVQLASDGSTINGDVSNGVLKGILDMGGNAPGTVSIRSTLEKLNTLLSTVATQINALQAAGRDMSGTLGAAEPVFELAAGSTLALFRYSVNPDMIADNTLLAAATDDSTATGGFAGVGDGRNALAMAQLRDTALAGLGSASVSDYLNATVSAVGVQARASVDRVASQERALNVLEEQRQQQSGVNVDEEMIDMLRFQRGLEASSRVMKLMDEVVQSILRMV